VDDKNLDGCKKMNLDTVKQPHGAKPTEAEAEKGKSGMTGFDT
jgi:hypothetical protein